MILSHPEWDQEVHGLPRLGNGEESTLLKATEVCRLDLGGYLCLHKLEDLQVSHEVLRVLTC